jgi:asparagine synthase (glutamine-hydrolysing)
MCAIFGYNSSNANAKDFHRLLIHRGPDYQKNLNFLNFTVGHNLLAIRDEVEKSIQPVETDNQRFIFSFNGQIYNNEYLKKKFNLRKDTILDTEVVIAVIDKISLDFIKYIKGMFAISLIDKKNKKLYLYRDQSGQKPLYFYFDKKNFIYSSEIDPIRRVISPNEYNSNILPEILNYGFTVNDETYIKNLYKVLPGQMIEYCFTENHIKKNNFSQNKKNDFTTISDEISGVIKNTIQTQNKIALNLSGGLDSNVILYEAIKNTDQLLLFVCKYDTKDNIYNEDFKIASSVTKKLGLKLNVTDINEKDYVNSFIESKLALSESNRNISDAIYYLNYKNQKTFNIRTVLTGDGGDELFVGYERYFIKTFFRRFLDLYFSLFKKQDLNIIINLFKKNYYSYIYKNTKNNFISNQKNNFLRRDKLFIENFNNFINSFYTFEDSKDYRQLFLYLDNYVWQSNEAFPRNDHFGMKFNIETRSPFLEYDLKYSFYNNLPGDIFDKKINKYYLRASYENKISEEVIKNKKKLGWTVPKDWLESEKLREVVLDNLPKKDDESIKWNKFYNYLSKKKNFMLDRSLYGLVFFGINLKNKINAQ